MLDSSKETQERDIPAKIIKENDEYFAEIIREYFIESLDKGIFPDCLKIANIIPVFNKGRRTSKHNY